MTTTDEGRPQTVMGRVLVLLEPFRESGSLTLTELAERTGFPRSSTHRMLLQLVEVGWLRRSGTTYQLGPKMMELGSLAQNHDRVYQAAVSVMYQLRKRTGMVVQLSVLEGDELLCLEQFGGRWAAMLPTYVGQRRPAWETVEGAALLALRNGHIPAVREQVVESGAGERVRCLAVAFDAGRPEIAALSLAAPLGWAPEGVDRELVEAAGLVAAELAA